MSSTSFDVPSAAPRHEEELDPSAIARQLERALQGLAACAAPEKELAVDGTTESEVARRRRLAAWVAGLPRTKQLRLAGAASLLDGQFDDEPALRR
jgi:hypothetical protein